ncbi:Nitroreductase [Catalinimonas alkaloidigena]|uniref:Nitroreductase n=1 Tax=Catalinimonas alkaloidigena TaxID=1075417 RepID=A0A1G9F569_9BACT|nr:nitroreductase family protein [Catalinimonas alkaloidigena]SDK83491.1 Nitroreductase [Catalinimonas alkaloidigena]
MNHPETLDIKSAKTKYPVHELLRSRWSARAFADKALDEDTLRTLFEAASWAPSSMNEQPWVYLYAHRSDAENFQKFFDCLMPGNQAWADRAAVLVLSLAEKNYQNSGRPNTHAWHDVGAANTNLLLQAASMDIYGHQMGGFDRQKTVQAFDLPEHLEPVCFIALGYLDNPETLEEPFRSRELAERHRKPLEQIAFAGQLAR